MSTGEAVLQEQLGFNVDVDNRLGESFRNVQMTPTGSGCSVTSGRAYARLQLCVADLQAAHAELAGRGVDASLDPAHRRERLAGGTRRPVELVLLLQGPGRQQLGRPGEARRLGRCAVVRARGGGSLVVSVIARATHARSWRSDAMPVASTRT